MKKSKNKKKAIVFQLGPKTQAIVTGVTISPEQAKQVRKATAPLCLTNWCSEEGVIGHIDNILPGYSSIEIWLHLEFLAREFPFLDIAITLMSNGVGERGYPVITLKLVNGVLSQDDFAHNGHSSPKRLTIKS